MYYIYNYIFKMPSYQRIKLNITPAQQKKSIKGGSIRLSSGCIGNGQTVMLHPMNYKKLNNAKNGAILHLSPGEMIATAQHHGILQPTQLEGSGFFDSLWSGIKSAGKFLKDSGIGTALADVGQEILSPVLGENITKGLREGLRSATGVGLKKGRKKAISASGLYL